jgi:hypothetical protein
VTKPLLKGSVGQHNKADDPVIADQDGSTFQQKRNGDTVATDKNGNAKTIYADG